MMRFISAVVIAFSLFVSVAQANNQQNYLRVSLEKFPELSTQTLQDLDPDKPVYLKFWATWCKPCMAQMPHFEHTYKNYKDSLNVIAVNININERKTDIQSTIKRFGLTMPVLLDNQGELGVELGLVGTPFHVLLNKDRQIVYTTHEADEALDKQLQQLAAGTAEIMEQNTAVDKATQQQLLQPWQQSTRVVFFTATWCDWYLADTRPDMANRCDQAQKQLPGIISKSESADWHIVVNHLWTGAEDLNTFSDKYALNAPIALDTNGVLFNQYSIRSIPTLLILKEGKEVFRSTDFSDNTALIKAIRDLQP